MVIPLKALITIFDNDSLIDLLSAFSCEKDPDIESFLRERAIEFENLSKSRTYLVFNQEDFENGVERPVIYGYVSLALKVLAVPDSVSNRVRKNIDGFSAKNHGQQIVDFPCYLIGQLSKNSNVDGHSVSGKDLLQTAYDIVSSAVELVGGRYMMVECRNKKELIDFYSENFFSIIDRIPDNDQSMVQMIRKI